MLGLPESNLINSSSQQGSSSGQELLVSTTPLHSFFLAPVGEGFLSSGRQPLQWCLFGEPYTKSGAPNHLSHLLPADDCARGDIKAKVRWEEPDPLTYLSWILSLSRLTHRWICSTPRLPFLRVRKPSPLTTSMQEIWASVFSLGRFIAAERVFKHRGWQKKCTVRNEKEAPGTCPEQAAPASVSQVWRLPDEMPFLVPWALYPGRGFGKNWACCRADTPSYSAWQQSCCSGGDAAVPFPPSFSSKIWSDIFTFLIKRPLYLGRELHRWFDKDINWLLECLQWGSICARCVKTERVQLCRADSQLRISQCQRRLLRPGLRGIWGLKNAVGCLVGQLLVSLEAL